MMATVPPNNQPMSIQSNKIASTNPPKLFSQENQSAMTMMNEDLCLDAGYYVHKKSLGEGGFGKVRLATHLKTNQKVAIKIMNKIKLGQDLERVRIEVEALKVLQHDNIAKMLQVIETDTEIYLVLEYCSGGELFDYLISKRRLTETEVRIIMKDLFKVLMYIHNRGFAHRDLKPENILFDENHRIKLIDFGLAANSSKNKSALAFLQTCCGSPAYAAPELLRGMTYSGPAVDVWSAGVLLYSLLVGQLPFDDENVNNLYKKIQIGRFMMPQWLSSDVRDLIYSMLKTNPAERITVAKALEHRWIKKGFMNSPPNDSLSIPSPNAIDTKAFQCCRMLFPQLTENDLRNKLKEFGYVTSTYLLLKNNQEAVKAVQTSLQLKMKPLALQNQQFMKNNLNDLSNIPRIAAIKRKLQLDDVSGDANQDNRVSPIKKIKENTETETPTSMKTPAARLINGINQTPVTPKLPPILLERKQMLDNSSSRKGTPYPAPRVPTRLLAPTARRRQIVSPKMKPRINDENLGNTPIPLVKSPLASQEPSNIKSPLREVRNQVLSPVKSPMVANDEKTTPKTPTTPINQHHLLKKSGAKNSSKKSLLRRLMASATPAKSHTPRKLDASTAQNNITMTSFKEPQECIDHLTKALRNKGVECKQKDFSLKCFYTDKIHSALKFDLEICRFNGLCVIHRKRLKGDAWNYKKICELILLLSNEHQLAALKQNSNLQQQQSKSIEKEDQPPIQQSINGTSV